MRTMHLFAGIGGGILADLILGHTPIVAVEWDKYACRVLRERVADGWFPGMQVYEGDVRLFDPSEYAGRVDCIHAGFPCQDISNAGKQAGVGEETRSGLYREVLRVADMVRPEFLFLENVSAILSNGLGTVLGDLASRSYDARWICVRASDVGANHQRDRWWLLAKQTNTASEGLERKQWQEHQRSGNGLTNLCEKLAFPKLLGRIYSESKIQPAEGRIDALCDTGASGEDVAYAGSSRQPGSGESIHAINKTQASDGEAIEPWNGSRPKFWSIEPALGRVANGIPDRVGQLKGYGNAQVPLQAAAAYQMLMKGFENGK